MQATSQSFLWLEYGSARDRATCWIRHVFKVDLGAWLCHAPFHSPWHVCAAVAQERAHVCGQGTDCDSLCRSPTSSLEGNASELTRFGNAGQLRALDVMRPGEAFLAISRLKSCRCSRGRSHDVPCPHILPQSQVQRVAAVYVDPWAMQSHH